MPLRLAALWILSGSLCFAFQAGPIAPRARRASISRPERLPAADLRVDVPLVLIPVHVTTPLGASVTDLRPQNFHLFEDGVEQRITQFAREDAPISIGLLFDDSGSMKNKIRKSSEAAAAFFKTANAGDEFFLIEFNEKPRLEVAFTPDSSQIYRRIARAKPAGRTSLLDAIHMGLEQMKQARNVRKAIVILSDGGDNRSRYTEDEIMAEVREADVQVYAMGIFDPAGKPKKTPEEQNGPSLLTELAEETGGRHYPASDVADLPSVCAKIGVELRNQYVLGYSPTHPADGTFRYVKVTAAAPGMPPLRAHHRKGYYASAE
ncbi:MAG: VWA domain-containing protein [Bryobacteraceae bacterium]